VRLFFCLKFNFKTCRELTPKVSSSHVWPTGGYVYMLVLALVADVVMRLNLLLIITASSYIPQLLEEASRVSNRKDLCAVVTWPS
jgi:hypothetical protein